MKKLQISMKEEDASEPKPAWPLDGETYNTLWRKNRQIFPTKR